MSAEAAVKYVTETPIEEVERVAAWINSEDYKEKNFARQALRAMDAAELRQKT